MNQFDQPPFQVEPSLDDAALLVHELNLAVNPFPPLPFFTCGKELFPGYRGPRAFLI
jgi:hypothetical protein